MVEVKRVLFVCSANQLRSPTAEQLFSGRPGFEVASAGLNRTAAVPVTPELLKWADVIFVMERQHRTELATRFRSHLRCKRLICLDIPDEFGFMDPKLVAILNTKLESFFRA